MNDLLNFLEHIGDITDKGVMTSAIMIEISISLLLIFSLRYILIMRSNRIPIFKSLSTSKKKKGAIINHIGLEIIVAFLIAFILIMIIKSGPENYFFNMFFAPFLGLIISLCIDNWYLIPKEATTMFNKEGSAKPQTLSEMVDVVDIIDQNIIDSDDFRPIVAKAINKIKEVQQEHDIKINTISEKCDSTIDLLEKLQRASMNDKKIALKEDIYKCLNQGFVTPHQRERIVTNYNSYHDDLNGNSEVQLLYENHFLNLKVHEERRKENKEVKNDRRQNNNTIPYGKYDNEC